MTSLSHGCLAGFLLQSIIVGGLHRHILLVVFPLVVEELLQNLSAVLFCGDFCIFDHFCESLYILHVYSYYCTHFTSFRSLLASFPLHKTSATNHQPPTSCLSKGLNLVLWDALLELIRSTELLVELLRLDFILFRLRTYKNNQHTASKNLLLLVASPFLNSECLVRPFAPRLILCLLQQECLVLRAQGLLPGVEVILEAPHGHLAATRSGRVHDKATLARQGTQHPGAQRQQHHGEEVHGANHGEKRPFLWG